MGAGITEKARRLRRDQTDAEATLWHLLRSRGLGVKFRRQYPVGPYITDFACIERGLVVELDGSGHATPHGRASDAERTRYLNAAGFRVVRFWNNEVLTNLDGVVQVIQAALRE
ncbi:endonuclease domain-containing protein [Deinococcus soli (ex Cha et al. 2016)]|uniref:Very-short-patch-repair endonuclease n=2 Tax=Deinococcus soli (ex Cha et al. 2016) TaxID=1309411 RepID=A0AAE4BLQ1_9DEIO|nr:endonuclease domain-containing protein [Deinococcus soli (ex Cha et al. 2016)]MDR6219258.1 very-short-patch-repair endonuclease [Deinococcus soli (ex Cha et al. 2016)]MDR6329507.1 very-short-patch-repair endonuclease [Deinococcus soli (ex Cha et al. 2016)]MDR6752167.1 very-short-patch-repair endonuclease [Deinococcus soli (ex Cha et al. 2016)]